MKILTIGAMSALLRDARATEGGKVRSEIEFQAEVLDGITSVGKKQQNLTEDVTRLQADTKASLEALAKAQADGSTTVAEITQNLKRVEAQLHRERLAAYGSPIQRIKKDSELRNLFAASVRNACRVAVGQKALGEDSSPGSTLINSQLANEIYDSLAQYGAWNTLGVRRLGTKITKFPVKTVRPTASFVLTEGSAITADTAKAGTSLDLEVELIGALIAVSRQLLEDAEFDITADVLDDFVEAYNFRLDYAAFAADGTADATNGGMTGIFQGGTAATAATGHTTVKSLTVDDLASVLTTVDSGILNRPCAWWMHPQILAQIALIKDSNGRPIFQNALEAPTPMGIGSIFGYPVNLVQAAPSAATAGSKVAVFGDPQAAVVGVRSDFQFEASDEYLWSSVQRSFRGVGRAGVKIRKASALAVVTTAAS